MFLWQSFAFAVGSLLPLSFSIWLFSMTDSQESVRPFIASISLQTVFLVMLLMNIRMAMVMMITWLDWSFMISAVTKPLIIVHYWGIFIPWISRSLDIVIFSQSFCGAGVVWRVKACWTSWTCWKGARTGAGTWAQNWTPAWCLLRRPACWWDAWKGLINWLKLRSMGLST